MESVTMRRKIRDKESEFRDLLYGLNSWEKSLLGKDKIVESQKHDKNKLVGSRNVGEGLQSSHPEVSLFSGVVPLKVPGSNQSHYRSSKESDSSQHSGNISTIESTPNASSEKELGNEYFKKKKYKDAIECYSRSIALMPTAAAFANRAIAHLKIKRYEDAENDCTEALNLDDHYVKAYSRRASARKELGKLKAATEDAEFALRLEPTNQELKKQHEDLRALHGKDITMRASQEIRNTSDKLQTVGGLKLEKIGVQEIPRSEVVQLKSSPSKRTESKTTALDLASRAASRLKTAALENIVAPKSAYQFEVAWRALSHDSSFQANFLKTVQPEMLPQLFKSALSASILADIVKCVACFFREQNELAFRYLESLSHVPRFEMIIMCLPSKEKSEMKKIWDAFCDCACPVELAEALCRLRSKYCTRGWEPSVGA